MSGLVQREVKTVIYIGYADGRKEGDKGKKKRNCAIFFLMLDGMGRIIEQHS